MSIPSYNRGYPPDGSSLGQTKATIRDNLDGTFLTLAVDHVNNNGQPGSQPAGYHTVIHEVPQANVSTVSGYNQVFSGVPGSLVVNGVTTPAVPANGDQQLYSLTGGGILAQLTGYLASGKGYAWMGGVLVQWGDFSMGSSTSMIINYPIPFPNNVFIPAIIANTVANPSQLASVLALSPLSKTGFSAVRTATAILTYYFIAIGN